MGKVSAEVRAGTGAGTEGLSQRRYGTVTRLGRAESLSVRFFPHRQARAARAAPKGLLTG